MKVSTSSLAWNDKPFSNKKKSIERTIVANFILKYIFIFIYIYTILIQMYNINYSDAKKTKALNQIS